MEQDKSIMTLTKLNQHVTSISRIEDAISCTPIKIQIQKHGSKLIGTQLMAMILDLGLFFNVGKPITEDQAAQTASLLIEKYPIETLEDFSICFKKAKMGDYGKVYDRLDGHIIFGWFQMYLDEKYSIRERLIQEEKKKNEKEESERVAEIDRIRSAYKNHKYKRPQNGNTLSNSFVEALREKYKVEYEKSIEDEKQDETDNQTES